MGLCDILAWLGSQPPKAQHQGISSSLHGSRFLCHGFFRQESVKALAFL